NNGVPSYTLASTSDNFFHFDNTFFNKIEIVGAQMSTLSVGDANTDAASWFALSGFLDFVALQDNNQKPFDLLSFGSDPPPPGASAQTGGSGGQKATTGGAPPTADTPRKGLAFSNLGIRMSYPVQTPLQRVFAFVTDNIRFDVATSTPRPASLFLNFALEINGLASGSDSSPPTDAGFLTVVTDAALTGVDGSPWYGIEYTLNLGTPGALAGKVGLTASLVTAWSPNSTDGFQGVIGLKLPGTGGGAKLRSLQNALKLPTGHLHLTTDQRRPLQP